MKPGTLIAGKYRLKKPLGDGAMGLVWSAVNERTEREVALKMLHPEYAKMTDLVERIAALAQDAPASARQP